MHWGRGAGSGGRKAPNTLVGLRLNFQGCPLANETQFTACGKNRTPNHNIPTVLETLSFSSHMFATIESNSSTHRNHTHTFHVIHKERTRITKGAILT